MQWVPGSKAQTPSLLPSARTGGVSSVKNRLAGLGGHPIDQPCLGWTIVANGAVQSLMRTSDHLS